MSETDIINGLNNILRIINGVVPVILLIAGTFGHLCNLIIFSKQTQRTNPTSIYFLSGTIMNLIALYFGMVIRYLQDVANINIVNTDLVICKIRPFVFYLSLSLSNWYIILATIDRYLISSNNHRRRQLSTLKNAYCSIGLITIIFILSYCHILILYNIQDSFCYPQYGPYRTFNDCQILIQYSLLPPILMTIFGILTLRNIRLTRQRVANTINTRIRQRDIQLSKMLLLQVIITVICSLPLAITQLITTVTLTSIKSPLRLTIENFATQMGRHLAFLNCSISFYLYTLVGSQFRLELQQFINRVSMFICHRRFLERNQVDVALQPALLVQENKGCTLPSISYTNKD